MFPSDTKEVTFYWSLLKLRKYSVTKPNVTSRPVSASGCLCLTTTDRVVIQPKLGNATRLEQVSAVKDNAIGQLVS